MGVNKSFFVGEVLRSTAESYLNLCYRTTVECRELVSGFIQGFISLSLSLAPSLSLCLSVSPFFLFLSLETCAMQSAVVDLLLLFYFDKQQHLIAFLLVLHSLHAAKYSGA